MSWWFCNYRRRKAVQVKHDVYQERLRDAEAAHKAAVAEARRAVETGASEEDRAAADAEVARLGPLVEVARAKFLVAVAELEKWMMDNQSGAKNGPKKQNKSG